jgi:mannose/fructose/N-acetylgalactosamine-specific phosphotransferase system component IIB
VPLLLARIDDRLIHGQVAHGWARPLGATFLAIVSDALRADPADAALYLLAAPDGTEARVVSVEEALRPEFRIQVDANRSLLLFPGPDEALRVAAGGFPLSEVNVGGLHFAPGRRELLPYVYLDEADAERLRRLASLGVKLVARDLPGNRAYDLVALLGGTR